MTMEQPRIQARLMDLGVQLQTAVELTGVRATAVGWRCRSPASTRLARDAGVRQPRDGDDARPLRRAVSAACWRGRPSGATAGVARSTAWAMRGPRNRRRRRLRGAPRGARIRCRGQGPGCGAVQAGADRDRALSGPRRARGAGQAAARAAAPEPRMCPSAASEVRHRAVDVVQLVEPEQADAEGLEVGRLVALQRHAGGGLQALAEEGLAAVQAVVVGVADDHARRLEALRRHAAQARWTQAARAPGGRVRAARARSFSKP